MVKANRYVWKTLLAITLSIFSLFMFGCITQVEKFSSGNTEIENVQGNIPFSGRVVYKGFEGGFWGIVSDDGERYDPLVLPEQFQVEGMRVEGKVRRRNVAHFHMWGTIVELIELRPETSHLSNH